MKTKISLLAVRFYSEHCFVQHPMLKVEDENCRLWKQLKKFCNNNDINAYMNHFVIEGVDVDTNVTVFLGYNDGIISLGFQMLALEDSKKFNINNPLLSIYEA